MCVSHLKAPRAGAAWRHEAGVEGAEELPADVRLGMSLNLRQTLWRRQTRD